MHKLALLTNAQMQRADDLAVKAGVASLSLMAAAGAGVARAVQDLGPDVGRRVHVLCGPGNNGGDGFVAAEILTGAGFDVQVFLLGDVDKLSGDARVVAGQYSGEIHPLDAAAADHGDIFIDALFGAGLTRPLSGVAADIVSAVNARGRPVVAVDVPSGLNGDTGAVDGVVMRATHTVTFFRLKPGHLLQPGRALCGTTTLVDIGTPQSILDDIKPTTYRNDPSLWGDVFPHAVADGHKYTRGHAVVVSGPATKTGAARLAARGALRVGAGLVTVASPLEAEAVNAAHLTAIMIDSFASRAGLADMLSDARKNAVLIGPGRGVIPETRDDVLTILETDAAVVLDADALTVFQDHRDALRAAISAKPDRPVVLTPHGGEFARLFPDVAGSKLERAKAAADLMSCTLVLKGADTVIAEPGGRAAINDNAPGYLATAGSGDVLAGFIVGLLAQQMPAFEAASAAVWVHGAAAQAFGVGLIAEDLPEQLPKVLGQLHAGV